MKQLMHRIYAAHFPLIEFLNRKTYFDQLKSFLEKKAGITLSKQSSSYLKSLKDNEDWQFINQSPDFFEVKFFKKYKYEISLEFSLKETNINGKCLIKLDARNCYFTDYELRIYKIQVDILHGLAELLRNNFYL